MISLSFRLMLRRTADRRVRRRLLFVVALIAVFGFYVAPVMAGPRDCAPDGSLGECEPCYLHKQCQKPMTCCPYLKKCIPKGGACYGPAKCNACAETNSNYPDGCQCENPNFPDSWLKCAYVDVCAANNGGCGSKTAASCKSTGSGLFKCTCKTGYIGNPPTTPCTKGVNRCSVNNGGCGTLSSGECRVLGDNQRTCACRGGYYGTPPNCKWGTDPNDPNNPGTDPNDPNNPGYDPNDPNNPGYDPNNPNTGYNPNDPDAGKDGTGSASGKDNTMLYIALVVVAAVAVAGVLGVRAWSKQRDKAAAQFNTMESRPSAYSTSEGVPNRGHGGGRGGGHGGGREMRRF